MAPPDGPYHLVDLEHLGHPESVAAAVLVTAQGPVVVDPGPASTLEKLRGGIGQLGFELRDLVAVLLTHIHLDHAGATGTLARAAPGAMVYVHELGAPHLADPGKLLGSATRLYGARMDELWGEVAPVPGDRIAPLRGGEVLQLGTYRFEVAYTPGHASHHVCYLETASKTVFVGDTAGIHGPRLPVVLPVTPPPDFDLDAWLGSIETILAWKPREIVLTHYGPGREPVRHFTELREGLLSWAGYAKASLAVSSEPAAQLRWFVDRLEEWIAGKAPSDRARAFLEGAGPEACWQGLVRYWSKRT